MKRPTYTASLTLTLPLEKAFIVCMNHMNYVPSHKLKEYSDQKNPNELSFVEHLRMPWSLIVETINFKLQKINDSETHVTVTSMASLPISSYGFTAIKKVLHYLKQTKFIKENT